MPKPFLLGIEVEEIALGKIMRVLNKMPGVVKLHMDFNKPNGAHSPAAPKFKKKFDMTASEFILTLLDKDQMRSADMKDHFSDVGRQPSSVASSLSDAYKAQLVKKNAEGVWSLTKKGHDKMRYLKNK